MEGAIQAYPDSLHLLPRTVKNGKTMLVDGTDWTQGFFPGTLWNMYRLTGDEKWRIAAENYTEPLEGLKDMTGTHNLGFLLNCSFGRGYELTANQQYKKILIEGARTLIKRYNPNIGAIKSWDFAWDYPVIIDNMMNLELLFTATKITGDSTFQKIALDHANTTMKNHYRDDFSSYHVVDYDSISGKAVWKSTHQGQSDVSAWARGQAWGLYGYTLAFRETGNVAYLDFAKNIADYILRNPDLQKDKILNEPRDASAAAILCSAFLELYTFTNDKRHLDIATEILQTLSSKAYLENGGGNHHFLLKHSVGHRPKQSEVDVPINYADYYYTEALVRYSGIKSLEKIGKSKVRTADGYKGIWFELGQPYPYGDKYSGGLGTYTAKHRPLAKYSSEANKTFFVYGGTTKATEKHLLCMIGAYDRTTNTLDKPVVVFDKMGVDDPHDNPSIFLDDKGYIWVFVSGRNTNRKGFKFRSNVPLSIEKGFRQITEEVMTYPQPLYLPEKGFFHFFTKYSGIRELYYETSEDGMTWTDDKKLAGIKEPGAEFSGHYQVSGILGDRMVTFFNRHPNGDVDKRTDLYYLETRDFGKTWQDASGKKLSVPLSTMEPGRIVDYASEDRNVYLKDVNFDKSGNPLCLYLTSKSHKPGPDGGDREWKIAQWKNKVWEIKSVTVSDHNYDMGSLYIDGDAWKVIAPIGSGPQPNQTGGEVEQWESNDAGETWKMAKAITSGSRFNQSYVRRPDAADKAFFAFWADGDPEEFSQSRLYFMDSDGHVRQMPYYMN